MSTSKTTLLLPKKYNHKEMRELLLRRNFVINTVILELKKRFKSELKNAKDIKPDLITKDQEIYFKSSSPKTILDAIQSLADKLQVDIEYLKQLIDEYHVFLEPSDDTILVSIMPVSLERSGIYIRLDPTIGKKEWLKKLHDLRQHPYIEFLYPLLDKSEFNKKRHKSQIGYSNEISDIILYLEIESKINQHVNKKQKSVKSEEETGISVIDGILEEYLSKKYEDIEDDKLLNEMKKKFKDTYYRIATRYKLPTFTELKTYLKII